MIKAFKFIGLALILSCQPKIKTQGDEIFSLVEKQLEFGPRLNNSEAKEKCVKWIESFAKKLNYQVKVDRWEETVEGEKRSFANIIVTKKGNNPNGEFIITGSHYDTKQIHSAPNFTGANDGASSTAALLFVIKQLANWQSDKTIHFIFFDGEECFGHNNNYKRPYQGKLNGLHGSQRYANQLLYQNKIKKCTAVLIMDMIGDKDLDISFPYNNSKKLISQAMDIAKNLNLENYFSYSKQAILDDHLPFHELGIPAINFIDFSYGKNNKFWHTEEDTIDKLSPKSLETTTKVFTQLLKNLAQ